MNTGVNQQRGSVNTLLRHQWGSNDLDDGHPLFGKSNSLEVGKVFADFVPSISIHVKGVRTRTTFVQPLEVVNVGSEMAEEDGSLEGVLEVGVSDVEPVEGCGGNAACVEDLIAAGLRIQREFESVQTFASGSEWSDALLYRRRQL